MQRTLITGVGGSIGHHVFAHLMQNTDWEAVGIDSFRHMGVSERVTELFGEHPEWRTRTKIFTHDLAAPISDKLIGDIGRIDYIINLASMSDVFASIKDPVPFVTNNVAIALNMLEYARRVLPRVFLQISTDEIYGPTEGKYMHQEWEPVVPSSPYSASKAAQESIAIAYWRTYNVPLIIVNLMNNFGERQSPNKFPAIVQRKVQAGQTVTIHGSRAEQGSRAYIHSSNTADAFLFLLKHELPHLHVEGTMDKPDRYNIPGDAFVTNFDLAEKIANLMGAPLASEFEPFTATRPGHDRHYGLDGSKLQALGWKSPKTFDECLSNTVKWQQANPEWLRPSKS